MQTHTNTLLTAIIVSTILAVPMAFSDETDTATKMAAGQPFTQDMILTAYYSPLPDQCCYVKGSYEDDVILNGNGTHGADGTPVYPGMIAAPGTYPFGTRIVLPGIGTMTVHDRGGAIRELDNAHRIDVWAGTGEEGLARALAFGVQHVQATVYPPSSTQPAESFDLASLPSPFDRLLPFSVGDLSLASLHPAFGSSGPSVLLLQKALAKAGYLKAQANGHFGDATRDALGKFYTEYAIADAMDKLSEAGGAMLEAVLRRIQNPAPVPAIVDKNSAPAAVAQAKRTLRFLGYYKGRTDGNYDHALRTAIIAFQKEQHLIGNDASSGAGRIGPKTSSALTMLWRKTMAKKDAERTLALRRLDQLIAEKDLTVRSFLSKKDKGAQVSLLQSFLVDKGYLKKDQITGLFASGTEEALIRYQLDKGIIASRSDTGAGRVGPATLLALKQARRLELLRMVRAEGWEAI